MPRMTKQELRAKFIREQLKWIREHGATRWGYTMHYADPNDLVGSRAYALAVYQADLAQLADLETSPI